MMWLLAAAFAVATDVASSTGCKDGTIIFVVYRKSGHMFARQVIEQLQGRMESEKVVDVGDKKEMDRESPCRFLRLTQQRGPGNALRLGLNRHNISLLGSLTAAGAPFRVVNLVRAPSRMVASDYQFSKSGAEKWMGDTLSHLRSTRVSVRAAIESMLADEHVRPSIKDRLAASLASQKMTYTQLLRGLDETSGAITQAYVSRANIEQMLANERMCVTMYMYG